QGGEVVAEVPATALADNTPIYEREVIDTPEYALQAWQWQADDLPDATANGIDGKSWNDVLLTLLDWPSIASKRWVYRQYDHQVQNNAVVLPGGADAAVVRVRSQDFSAGDIAQVPHSQKGVAATVDCNGRYVYLDPYEGARAAVAEAARNLSCVGAEPIAVTDNLNFGSPEKPVGYWQLAEACRGISDACRALNTPVTGGNVSLYNETIDSQGRPQSIYPTPVIGMVGLLPDIRQACGQGWRESGASIYRLGRPATTLGGSAYLQAIFDRTTGLPPRVDLDLEARVQAACRHGIRQGWIQSAHDCSDGGLAIALAESCISGNLGAIVQLPPSESQRLDDVLFGEGGARIVVSIAPQHEAEWDAYVRRSLPGEYQHLGTVAGDRLQIAAGDSEPIATPVSGLAQAFYQSIPRRLQT
ncbi:MAG: AIR synthase related protein, partial [Cyanobacteria bacterium J06639_1]